MDGIKSGVNRSLQRELSWWLVGAIIAIAAGTAAVTFASALEDAHAAQDRHLLQTSDLIGRIGSFAAPGFPVMGSSGISNIDLGQRIVLRILADRNGPRALATQRAPAFSSALSDGIQTVRVGNDHWRVFVASRANGLRLAVAQQTTARDALARAQALRALLPFMVLVPLLLVMVGMLVRQMFKPLRLMATELSRRDEGDLGHLNARALPSEVAPFVAAINSLLERVNQAISQQRRFVADAAHELRSPLTAMSLQAEWLSGATLPPDARQRLEALRDGLARSRVLLDQLLSMARYQELRMETKETTSLRQVVRDVLEDLMPLAEKKHIDIGVVGNDDALINAHHIDLTVLVKNLVDNAIRYTPAHGSVDIRIQAGGLPVLLEVSDTGPGIAPAERERVFDAFYRVLGSGQVGSGLGLSIVRAIAGSINAQVSLTDRAPGQPGLMVRVMFTSAVVQARPAPEGSAP
ncbi:two-component sensor histidine kinase [Massilia sp. PAMC28688]|uniref:ATP-binding protein n=1 Tax=Massilia sp. PAMC28688 TaxID=2861283 RepID=UPI001C625C01|nr:ATP-binding protein [Massilia sp. PAMC28688]QYF93676.1 two-component sensor histidine kinase [Massilia sp. PAMC28688]